MKPYYEHNGIVIYHGDCREILPRIAQVDAVVTDPPYGLESLMQPGGNWWGMVVGGDPKRKSVMGWDSQAFADIGLILKAGRESVIWGGNYYWLRPSRGWLAWYKVDAPPTMANFELAWTSRDKNSRLIWQSIAATNSERVGHPTQKPLSVMLASIAYLDFPQTILDPFCGSQRWWPLKT